MRLHAFGRTGREVAVIGQGTWKVRSANRRESVAALHHGIDLGMNHIDTAEMYDDAEEVIAEAVQDRRSEVFLVSKVLPSNASKKGTIAACEKSLSRLKTDHLDCYLLHWPGRHPLAETIESFEKLQKDGKIRSWGVSNFDVEDLDEALSIAGEGRIACNQVLYHLGERAIEHAVIPWCEKHDVAVVAYTPFGTEAFPGPGSKGGRVLDEVARRYDATPRQIALAWLTRRTSMFAIPKSSNVEHTTENAAAGRLHLAGDDIEAIDAAFPLGRKPSALPTV